MKASAESAPGTVLCPRCQGTGRHGAGGGPGNQYECYLCHGIGRRPEPQLSSSSIRRWVKVGQGLAGRSLSAADVDHALANVYGRNSTAGILGAMREYGLTVKDNSSPAIWSLSADGEIWQSLFCRGCLEREPKHKKSCKGAPAASAATEPVALASLLAAELDDGEELVIAIALQSGSAQVSSVGGRVKLVVDQRAADELSPAEALVLAQALERAAHHSGALPRTNQD